MEDGLCKGVIAMSMADGNFHRIFAKSTILATGGFGRMYSQCTVAHIVTGDGSGLVCRQGLPL